MVTLAACKRGPDRAADGVTLTLGAYTTPREAYAEILPAFAAHWRARTGSPVKFQESYLASGAQARAIAGGFEADVAALSLAPDIEKLRGAGLVEPGWASGPHGGIVTRSLVVIGVRPGNPKGLRAWSDLARPDVEVLTPNVRTSGGAMWNVLAIYGATLRGPSGSEAGAQALLAAILRNVRVMDRSGRDAMLTFERGVGDAIITYENEILVGRKSGKRYDYVIPEATIVIENPVAVVGAFAARHGTGPVARAFVEFLFTPAAQRSYAAHGLRPVLDEVANEVRASFPPVTAPFTVADLGGWGAVEERVFAEGALYDRALAESRAGAP